MAKNYTREQAVNRVNYNAQIYSHYQYSKNSNKIKKSKN